MDIHRPLSPPDEILQHGALPCALATHHGDLRQVHVGVLPDGRERILHSVNERDKILHPPVPHRGDRTSDRNLPVKSNAQPPPKKKDIGL